MKITCTLALLGTFILSTAGTASARESIMPKQFNVRVNKPGLANAARMQREYRQAKGRPYSLSGLRTVTRWQVSGDQSRHLGINFETSRAPNGRLQIKKVAQAGW